ncbi:MAG: G8 domain-containing protein [Pseudomonadota bacterium]
MSKKNRSFLYGALLPALLLGSVMAVHARSAGSTKPTNWSDPATWPNRKVPVAGDKVTIERGKEVILDVSPPTLNGLHIEGKLSFADKKDLELTTEWIMVHGELQIGTEAKPYQHKATITLTDNVKSEEMAGMGDRGIMLSGGTLNLHGNRTNSWTKLASTAEAGATSIQVLNAAQWRVGDEIVLALDGLRSPPGRASHHLRHQRQHAHARQEARVHALRQDHLRRGRARRSRPAHAQHQDPGRHPTRSRPSSAVTSWRW